MQPNVNVMQSPALARVCTSEPSSFEPSSFVIGGYAQDERDSVDPPPMPVAAFSHDGASVSTLSASVIGKACAKIPPHKVRLMNWKWILDSNIVSKHL